MLSISPPMRGLGNAQYYLKLARDDYYNQNGEEPGQWFGKGVTKLGLQEVVLQAAYENLLMGYAPDGALALVQNAGKPRRQAGWDLTFSAPKSVSVAWTFAPEATRALIEEVHRAAVKDALTYVQEACGITRRGKGGGKTESVGLLFATFLHHTSRALDPQLHTHCVLLNLGFRSDGTTGALRSQDFFRAKMTAGALYRASLASGLSEKAGLRVEAVRSGFELASVPKGVCAAFSKRRRAILKAMAERGSSDAVTAKHVTLATRPKKVQISRADLFSRMRQTADSIGWTETERARAFQPRSHVAPCSRKDFEKAFSETIEKLPAADQTIGKRKEVAARLALQLHADATAVRPLFEQLNNEVWGNSRIRGSAPRVTGGGRGRAATEHMNDSGTGTPRGASPVPNLGRPGAETFQPPMGKHPHGNQKINTPAVTGSGGATHTANPFGAPSDHALPGRHEATRDSELTVEAQLPKERKRSAPATKNVKHPTKAKKKATAYKPWNKARVAELDPRGATTNRAFVALYLKCRQLVLTGAIHAPVHDQPNKRSAAQAKANREFAKQLADKLDTVFVEKQTAKRVTWNAVRIACQEKADAWALFYTLRNMAPAAERRRLHVEKPKVFRKSPFKALREFRLPRLALGERARKWGDIVWKRDLLFFELRVQKKRLAPNAPRWSPVHGVEFRAMRLMKKNFAKEMARKLIPALKRRRKMPSSQHPVDRQTRSEAQSH